MRNERNMRTKSQIVFKITEAPLILRNLTISMGGAIARDAAAVEYWQAALAKFYGRAQIMLGEEASNLHKRRNRYLTRING
jgi:hypothetical protein